MVCVGEDNFIPSPSQEFVPGDKVLVEGSNVTFEKRTPFVTLGTVKKFQNGFVFLHLPLFGPACSSLFKVQPLNGKITIGDRYILEFPSNTVSPIILSTHSTAPEDDVHVLKEIYTHSLTHPRTAYETFEKGNSLYHTQEIVDHTNDNVITIDPLTAKDFDDAISWNEETREVFIHIVDIAHANITPDEAIGGIAANHSPPRAILTAEEEERLRNRCFTLYLGHEDTLHLLSEENASNLLSLVEGKPRHTITTAVKLTEEGLVESYKIYRSIISVKKRLHYDVAEPYIPKWLANLLSKRETDLKYSITLPALSFTPNAELVKTNTQDDSHKFVERCMVLCNMIVSKHLQTLGIYLPNRFHDKLRGFRPLNQEEKTNQEEVDSFLLLKRYARAKYDVDRFGHFGLDLKEYCHFTSPMRRYPDVLIHRLLAGWKIPREVLDEEVDWINVREKVSDSCHRYYVGWKMNRYMASFGTQKPWDIWITGTSPVGVMWFLPELNMNGFCFVGQITPAAFWKYDKENQELTSDKETLRVGDKCTGYFLSIDPVNYVVNLKIACEKSL